MRKEREKNHRKRRHTMGVTGLVLALVFVLGGCGSSGDSSGGAMTTEVTADSAAAEADLYDSADYEEAATDDGISDESGSVEVEENQTSEKIIYTYNYTTETKQFDTFMDTIKERINACGGYIESSDISGNASMDITRYGTMVIRIPADQMDDFLSMVEENSNVTYAGCSTENVTLTYVDLESHIKSLKIEQETLMELLEKATKLDDVLTLQSQLTEVRYELESYESQLRVYDNRIDYATLYLNIEEVERETQVADKLSYGEEIAQGLSDTFYSIGQGLRDFSIWLIVNLPLLLLWAVVILVIFLIVRGVRRSFKKHQEKRLEQAAKKIKNKKESEETKSE